MPIHAIEFQIDPNTWAAVGSVPPVQLTAAAGQGTVQINLDAALLFTGIWTRPPALRGFTLSDCWAWMRYFPAFSDGGDLRMRPEWTRIDPHHKTVASDDYGIGFTTLVLHNLLGFEKYADTIYVVNVLEQGQWLLRRQAKRGPAKSPDYIAYDGQGAISVLECKGTQTSRAELLRALNRGYPQKRGQLVALGGQRIIHQLVAGIFVPQHESRELALLAVHDPEKDDTRQELRKFPEAEIRRATEQVAFAKELAMFEMTETAAALVHEPGSAESLNEAIFRDTARAGIEARVSADGMLSTGRDHRWAIPLSRGDVDFRGIRFKAEMPLEAFQGARRFRDRDLPDDVIAGVAARGWRAENLENGVVLYSPVGARYALEWLE